MPRGAARIDPEMLARCERTIMRMAVARKIHPGYEPVILHLQLSPWRELRSEAKRCPYVPKDVKRHLALARKVYVSRNNSRLHRLEAKRAREKKRALAWVQRTKTASCANPQTLPPASTAM